MQVEIGKIYEGTVKNITKYGAFVEIPNPDGDKIMGMVHISEVSRSYVNEIRTCDRGQQVRVKAIGTNPQGKISLSMKQAEEGAEQHGHMETVGYDMYLRLLGEAVSEERARKLLLRAGMSGGRPGSGAHSGGYIESLSQRLEIYRRISDIRSQDDAMDVLDELIDRFGEPPASVKGLIDVA